MEYGFCLLVSGVLCHIDKYQPCVQLLPPEGSHQAGGYPGHPLSTLKQDRRSKFDRKFRTDTQKNSSHVQIKGKNVSQPVLAKKMLVSFISLCPVCPVPQKI